ncbi:MAG: phosphoenolpyruvate--protein phosphotransferase [Treponema sp.]|jgi:phosphotransferase system enzyme I (PtsI)|nr:phosphoenolpyruvate--protein phosphotransferase [Treponema sp.]
MKNFTGIPVSPGIAIGKAFLYLEDDFSEIPHYTIRKNQIEAEWKRLLAAIAEAGEEIRSLHERAAREMTQKQADIFQAHFLMLDDPEFRDQLYTKLKSSQQNIEWIVCETSRELTQKLAAASDSYLRERAVDIADVSRRLINKLLAIHKFSLADLKEDVILVAHDLLPSEVLTMNKSRVKGLLMDMGSQTSHTAILARAFEIPAVLGLSLITKEVEKGDELVLNGGTGQVIISPNKSALDQYKLAINQYHKRLDEFLAMNELPAETKDGHKVSLKANIEVPEEAEQISRYSAEGIGLYRSEFLFLTPGFIADEEEQYRRYSQVLTAVGELPVTIRTMDLGGDKMIPEYQTPHEKNPLLGWRAIRFSLAQPELFKTQLRAILRSSAHGNVRIMFPMISGIEELEQALALLEEAKGECRKQKRFYRENLEVGTMIEIPSAAMTADILAERSDFFSIGTNDLIQYSLAVDRGNEQVNYLAKPFHPGVLRFIKRTIDAAHNRGIRAAMCGELAGDPSASALLLGMGLDEFSMTASAIPLVKRIIRGASREDCQRLAEQALNCSSYRHISALVDAWMAENFPAG